MLAANVSYICYFLQQKTTFFRPWYRSTCVSRHLQLITGGFCCSKVFLPAVCALDGSNVLELGEDISLFFGSFIYCLCSIFTALRRVILCQELLLAFGSVSEDDHLSVGVIHFASAAVAVASSHMTVSSSTSWSRFKFCQWAHVDNVAHGLSLATIARRWLGEAPFVQICTTWTLTCPETVQQRPCMTREIETCLSDSRVGYNSVVDHRSRRPVLSPLRNCVDRCHVQPYWTSRCKPWGWMFKDISVHRRVWMIFDDTQHVISSRFTAQGRRSNIAEHWQPRKLGGFQATQN